VVAGDYSIGLNLHEWVIEAGRAFANEHSGSRIGP
jgi:hypothetical protein